jgi:hypothetical protein
MELDAIVDDALHLCRVSASLLLYMSYETQHHRSWYSYFDGCDQIPRRLYVWIENSTHHSSETNLVAQPIHGPCGVQRKLAHFLQLQRGQRS